jgi:hypothetical protein
LRPVYRRQFQCELAPRVRAFIDFIVDEIDALRPILAGQIRSR